MNEQGRTGHDTKPVRTRRDFLSKILGVWSFLTLIPFAGAIVKYLTPLKNTDRVRESLRLASVSDIAMNSARIFKFNKDPVIVLHTQSGQFKAFSARCTHLGCIVRYESEGTPRFHCNCHGSEFDLNGQNVSGPAPAPLLPLKITLDESSIIVSKI